MLGCEYFEAALLMELPDELFNLGDAALEDKITVVGLALGDLAGDGGQHQILHFAKIGGLPQRPGQLDVGHFGQHVLGRDDALGHQITAGKDLTIQVSL